VARLVAAIFIGGGRLNLLCLYAKNTMNAIIRKSILFASSAPHMNFEFATGAQPFCSDLRGGKKSDNRHNISRYHCNWF